MLHAILCLILYTTITIMTRRTARNMARSTAIYITRSMDPIMAHITTFTIKSTIAYNIASSMVHVIAHTIYIGHPFKPNPARGAVY